MHTFSQGQSRSLVNKAYLLLLKYAVQFHGTEPALHKETCTCIRNWLDQQFNYLLI